MKRLHNILFLILFITTASCFGYSFKPPTKTGAAGAPDNEETCTRCHGSSGNGSLVVNNLPNQYQLGEKYTLNVKLSQSGRQRWGFILTALDQNGNRAGTFESNDANTQVFSASGRQYIGHTSSGTAAGQSNSNTWLMGWIAPAVDTGKISFHASGNAANNNGENTGDNGYKIDVTIEAKVEAGVNIPDANLRAALEKALGKNEGDAITKEDLAGMESLTYEGKEDAKISDLTGLEYCVNLKTLNLVWNQISDMSVLANLPNLTNLDLHNNQISNILPLANLTSLMVLELYNNKISDISALANLTNLSRLYLSKNPLNNKAYTTHIPTFEARDIKVEYDIPRGVVLFEDANLEKAIRGTLGIPTELLKKEDLAQLTELVANDKEIVDLAGLKFCTNLNKLNLDSNKIADCTALSELNNLQKLSLNANPIEDFSFLLTLSSIQELALHLTGLKDLSSFSNLTKLRHLNIGHNKIMDLAGISDCKELANLILNANGIADLAILKPIQNLPNLSSLHLSYNPINNLQPLHEMKNLHSQITNLHLNSTDIKGLTALKQFRNLVWLSLSNLKILGLGDNHISQIASIVQNKEIAGEIILTNNPLSNTALTTDIPALVERGIKVEYDDASSDIVTFKDANLEKAIREALGIPTELLKKDDLEKLEKLRYVEKKGAQISDLTGLEHRISLVSIDFHGNKITDISALSKLTSIDYLMLSDNQIRNLSPLVNLTNVWALHLYSNQITDISVLANMDQLRELHFGSNPIKDISPLIKNTGITGNIDIKNSPLNNTSLSTHIPTLEARGIEVGYDDIPSDIIKISNASFESSLRKAIDIPNDILTSDNTSILVGLDLTDSGIEDLDIEALKSLSNLKTLNLTNNPLSANAVLKQIPELESSGITVDLGTSSAARLELKAEKPAIPASLSATTDIIIIVTDTNGKKVKREIVNLTTDKVKSNHLPLIMVMALIRPATQLLTSLAM